MVFPATVGDFVGIPPDFAPAGFVIHFPLTAFSARNVLPQYRLRRQVSIVEEHEARFHRVQTRTSAVLRQNPTRVLVLPLNWPQAGCPGHSPWRLWNA